MYEDSTLLRRGLRLDLGSDPKMMHFKEEMESSRSDVLTNRDLGMLELTTPELEHMIRDPTNDRFLGGSTGGFGSDSFRQLDQQGSGIITKEQHALPNRSFDSSLGNQPHQAKNLPCAALEAALSSSSEEEDFDTGSSQNTYATLDPARSIQETSFEGDSYFSIEATKPAASLRQATISTAPSIPTTGLRSSSVSFSSSAFPTNTLLPTAVHPGVSYLPFGTFHAIPARPKEEPMQMVPCLDGRSPRPYSSLSPINMDDQQRAIQERKRERNRLAARRCRTNKLNQIVHLEERVKELKEQNRALGDTAAALRTLMHRLQAQMSQHSSSGCPVTMMMTTTLDSSSFDE